MLLGWVEKVAKNFFTCETFYYYALDKGQLQGKGCNVATTLANYDMLLFQLKKSLASLLIFSVRWCILSWKEKVRLFSLH